jgi:putative oxidoreductase
VKGKKTIWIEQVALNLLRVVTGFLFWQHGAQKLLGFPGGEPITDFFGMTGLAGALELVGGTLLILGLFTRPVAFILSGQMAWAYFQVHAPEAFWPILNGGEMAAFYSFLFLYVAARGGGIASVDGLRQLRRERKPKGVAAGAAPEAAIPEAAVPQAALPETPVRDDDFPELTEEDLAPDPEIEELLKDHT